MNQKILDALSVITPEERKILSGSEQIDRSLYMEPENDRIMGSKLLGPESLLTIRPHTRFVHFPEHTHDYVEIVYMAQGTTTHIVDGVTIHLQQGELLLLGQNSRQEILPAGKDDLAVNFIIQPEFFRSTLPYLGDEESPLRRFLVDCLCGGGESSFLYFRVADVLPIQHLLENLLWDDLENQPGRWELEQMTFALLFTLLLAHTDRLYFQSQEQEAVFRVLNYLEGHYRDGSLSEISEQLHYVPATLSRVIKRKAGKSFTQLLQDKRLAQAAWLLRNTQMSVDDVSHAVGYENTGYFHQIFLARFGTSPKKHRDSK